MFLPERVWTFLLNDGLGIVLDVVVSVDHAEHVELGVGGDGGLLPCFECSGALFHHQLLDICTLNFVDYDDDAYLC